MITGSKDMNDWKDTARKQNKGFSLITVIIAVAFIGILGLLVLYMALPGRALR